MRRFEAGVSLGRVFAVAIAVVVAAVSSLSLAPAQASVKTPSPISTQIPLGTTSVGRIVVDATNSQVFISSPADSEIVVTDFTGTIKKTITGEAGADAMVLVGSTLYVALTTLGAIDRIDTGTLTETSKLVTGLFKPNDLVYAGSKLWTTTGQCGGSWVELASVDPSAVSPSVTTYPSAFTNTNALNYCAEFLTNHAANPGFIVAWASSLSPSLVTTFDVSGSTPTQVASTNVPEFADAVITPDQSHVIAAGGCCGGAFPEYNRSDFTSDGNTYYGTSYSTAVDATAANGGLMIAGSDEIYGFSYFIYQLGQTVSPVISYHSSNSAIIAGDARSVAFAPDGRTAFAVARSSDTAAVLDVLPIPVVPPPGSPDPPTNVTADAGVGSVTVSWTPSNPGASAITGYTVTSSQGAVVQVGAGVTSVTITGLSPTSHTFTVTATNAEGTSAPSAPSPAATPSDGGSYNPLPPTRILDTRNGNGGFPVHRVAAGTAINLQVTGRGGVPATHVTAVVMNVTVTGTTGPGYLTAYPTGAPRPTASNVNYVGGQTVPNLVEVAVGTGGQVSLYVGVSSADLVADVEGWVGDSTNSYGGAGLLRPMTPERILDTRIGKGAPQAKLGPNQSIVLQVAGAGTGQVPLEPGVEAVVMNVTVTNPTAASYLTIFPSNASSMPTASNLNFTPGQTVPNRVIVPLSSNGQVTIYNGFGTVDVIADVDGWFTAAGADGGLSFVSTVPARLFDSRSCQCRLSPGFYATLSWVSPPLVVAFVLNVTVTRTSGSGYLTLYAENGGSGPPLASDLNYRTGQTVANFTVVDLNIYDEAFDVYDGGGSTDFVIDAAGYYGAGASGAYSVAPTIVQADETGSYHLPRTRTPSIRTTIRGAE